MAIFTGDTVRIKSTVTDFDGNPVTNLQVTTAVVNLYDTSGNYVFQNQALAWDSALSYWYFDWQGSLQGTWVAQCVFTGGTFEVFDYATIRVKPLKITPTGDPH